ncbi:MAG: DNA mismatch repair endonuclease MutL [Longimicrobiales bacterium]
MLPDHVANQIAAGEVVERPASVVKELVENALDAGASRVEVRIDRGGKTRIRVSDDGCGMVREDAVLCLDRHATSKIQRAEDLHEIQTLGFRGEALPSIAAVSRLSVETSTDVNDTGTRIRSLAGRIQVVEDAPRRQGTTIEVQNLFLNTPARARFLGTVGVETRAVSEVIHSLALAHLDTHFTFEVNDRKVLDLPVGRALGERVAEIWRDASRAGLIPVKTERGGLKLTGVIQRPELARPGFRRAHLFVNGRPYRDAGVMAAADRGYRTTVPEGSRAWVFLDLHLLPGMVDVNVHPGKSEVRFKNRGEIEAFVESSVRETLEGVDSAAVIGEAPPLQVVREGPTEGDPPDIEHARGEKAPRAEDDQTHLFRAAPPDVGPPGTDGGVDVGSPGNEEAFMPAAPRPSLLQIHNSFILAETRDGMIIVDQHAAHERVLFEQIMARFDDAQGEGQRLLFPLTLQLTPQEVEVVLSVSGLLGQLGFELEPFGTDAILVQAVPSPHRYFNAEGCLRDMVLELTHGSALVNSARNQNERVAMSFACKAAIKAGQTLAPEEMQELFDQLFATELPYHDVHGRPTVVRLGLGELERKFGRT